MSKKPENQQEQIQEQEAPQLTVAHAMFFLINHYNGAITQLRHLREMPDDWTPQVDGKAYTPEEKEAFLTGVGYAVSLLGGTMDEVYEEAKANFDAQQHAQEQAKAKK